MRSLWVSQCEGQDRVRYQYILVDIEGFLAISIYLNKILL